VILDVVVFLCFFVIVESLMIASVMMFRFVALVVTFVVVAEELSVSGDTSTFLLLVLTVFVVVLVELFLSIADGTTGDGDTTGGKDDGTACSFLVRRGRSDVGIGVQGTGE
jgi:hypothetical protein